MVRSWVWLLAGVAHHGVGNQWNAVPVSTLACLAGLVLAGLRAVCLLSGPFSPAVWLVPGCVSRLMVGLCIVGWIALQPASVKLDVSCFVLTVSSEVVAGLSDVAVVLRPGRARRFVLVRRRRGRQWSTRPGWCSGPYGPAQPRLVAVGCPLCHLFLVERVLSWSARLRPVRV